MPEFNISYRYDAPSPQHPGAVCHGATSVVAEDADDACFKLTARPDLKNAKGLHIKSIREV